MPCVEYKGNRKHSRLDINKDQGGCKGLGKKWTGMCPGLSITWTGMCLWLSIKSGQGCA